MAKCEEIMNILKKIFIKDADTKEDINKLPEFGVSEVTNMQTMNYKVYHFKAWEKIVYFLLAFLIGAFVGFLFYGNLAKDEYGEPTLMTHILNIAIPTIVGLIAGKLFLPVRQKQIIEKRRRNLRDQFRDMLEGLVTSLGAGNNVPDSFSAVYNDLKIQYDSDAYIIKELEIILEGIRHNVPVENILMDFGVRSGIPDIETFANVFNISYRKGGNIKDVIRNTHNIISEKIEIAEDIETTVTSGKMDQKIMLILPIALISIIKFMSPEFAENFTTPTGVISTTIAIVCFIGAYFLGKTMLDIKV